ncbi:citrate transporter [Pseudomonas putida S11]|nr:citrate transporter [Pseudomonas putida S11]
MAPAFTGVFMEKMVGFIKLYFPVFLLGAVFGKLIELSGFSRSIVAAAIRVLGTRQAMLVIVLVCALLTYGGVSLFVVVFAVYPFAAEMFRQSNIPKRLIPATIALGAFSFTMDALPGTPQIQNIIPSTFFNTTAWAAPWLGLIGTLFVFCTGMAYLQRQRNKTQRAGEGYGSDLRNEPETAADLALPNPWLALSPLLLVGVMNLLFTHWIPQWYGPSHSLQLPGMSAPVQSDVAKLTAIWAVQAALLVGILMVLVCAFGAIRARLAEGTKRRRGRRLAGSHEHRLGIRLWRGDRLAAGLPGIGRRPARHPQPTGQRSDYRDLAGRHHRLCLGRHEHRPGGHGRHLHRRRQCRQHPARSTAPRGRHGQRWHGHPAAQRCGHYSAGRDRADPPRGLQGHFRYYPDQDPGGVRGHRHVLRHRHRLRSFA